MGSNEIWISESTDSVRLFLDRKEIDLLVTGGVFTSTVDGRNLKVDLTDDWRFPVCYGEESYALVRTVRDGMWSEYLLSNERSYTLETAAWFSPNMRVTCQLGGKPLFELRHARWGELFRYPHIKRTILTSEEFSGMLREDFDLGRDLPFLLYALKFCSYGRGKEYPDSIHGLRGW